MSQNLIRKTASIEGDASGSRAVGAALISPIAGGHDPQIARCQHGAAPVSWAHSDRRCPQWPIICDGARDRLAKLLATATRSRGFGAASASLVARYALVEAEDATMTAWLLVMVISNPQGYISVPNIASKQECERLAVEISAGIRSVYRCIEYRIGGSTIKWDGPIVGGAIGAP